VLSAEQLADRQALQENFPTFYKREILPPLVMAVELNMEDLAVNMIMRGASVNGRGFLFPQSI